MNILTMVLLLYWEPQVHDGGIGEIFGFLIIVGIYLLAGLCLLAHFFLYLKYASKRPLLPKSKKLQMLDHGFVIYVTMLAMAHAFLLVGWKVQGIEDVIWVHALSIGLPIILFGAYRRQRTIRLSNLKIDTHGFPFSVLISTSLASWIIYSVLSALHPLVLLYQADKVANGAPYCLNLERRGRPVSSLQDLTFLTMDKARGTHHLTMRVEGENGPTLYHWSYWFGAFLSRGTYSQYHCDRVPNFADTLPLVSNDRGTDYKQFSFNGLRLNVPKNLLPKAGYDYLGLWAVDPVYMGLSEVRSVRYVSMRFHQHSYDKPFSSEAEELLSLRRLRREYGYDIYPKKNGIRHYRIKRDARREITSVISCSGRTEPEASCHHKFIKDDVLFSFNYYLKNLPKATELERRLYELFQSFKVEG